MMSPGSAARALDERSHQSKGRREETASVRRA